MINEEIRNTGIHADQPKDSLDRKPLRFEDVITPQFLQMISRTSGGFNFYPDPNIPPGEVGYTNKLTKQIFYNPKAFEGSPEHGIPPVTREGMRGFGIHESGHHAPVVTEFDNLLISDLTNPDVIPDAYKGNSRTEERFLGSLYRHLDNALVDIWLESYMGRKPYFGLREDIESLYSSLPRPETYVDFPKPEQLMQILLVTRYEDIKDIGKIVDPDVFDSYKRIVKSGAITALMDRRVYENPFATKADEKRDIARKYQAYEQVFLPEYLGLLEAELDERKKDKQDAKQQGEGGKPMPGGQGGDPGSSSVPLTSEEEQEIIEQILSEMEGFGHKHSDNERALTDEEKEHFKDLIEKAKKKLEDMRAGKEVEEDAPPENKGKKGMDAIAYDAERMRREQKKESQRGLAGALQVKEASVAQWEQIKERRKDAIESLAIAFTEIFVDDRRKKMEYLVREGMLTPGLEYEEISAVLSGNPDPETRMREVRNPEFLQTEHEDIIDTSGSMDGLKLKMSIELEVIKIEAFKRAREILDAEQLIMDDEEPMKVGVTKFSDGPERVTELDDPPTDAKEILIIDRISMVGGGTDEVEALDQVYKGMKLRRDNVIKFITVLTDGQGNQAGVAPIMRQIEEDDEVIFLVVGLGDDQSAAQAIVDTYLGPLKDRDKNVHALAAVDPEDVIPFVIEFYKKEVEKRRTQLY